MRFDLGMGLLFTLASVGVGVVACSSSSSPAAPAEAGTDVCTSPLTDLLGTVTVGCPNDGNGTGESNMLPYDQAIEQTCSTYKLKVGDVQYGPCFEYLVFEVDMDSSGHNYSKCFYDVTTHGFVGVIYADGSQDQCGSSSYSVAAGMFDVSCSISGFQGGGAMFESCAPIVDAGGENMLLGQ
jgi:hypothetical protein